MFSKLQGKEFEKCPLKLLEWRLVCDETSRHFFKTTRRFFVNKLNLRIQGRFPCKNLGMLRFSNALRIA